MARDGGNHSKKIHWYKVLCHNMNLILWHVDRYGLDYVAEWNFESWNEPNNRDFDTLQFTIQGT